MNYEQFFADRISDLKGEGRYRVFADLERQVGDFPKATSHTGSGTLEDAIETLLGREIVDESDTVADMQAFARHRYRERLRDDRNKPPR